MDEILRVLNEKIIKANMHKNLRDEFNLLRTDEDRVKFTIRLMEKYDVIPKVTIKEKSTEESNKLRAEGNKIFVKKTNNVESYVEALKSYTKSVASALHQSKELALAYANRSAVLARIGKTKECIEDIERALKLEYPDDLKTKLYLRKAECLKVSGRPEYEEAYEEARSWLEKVSPNDPRRIGLEGKLRRSNKKIASSRKNVEDEPVPPSVVSYNSEIPCASDAIAVEYSERFGRHVIATRKIRPGEVLAVEKPYSLMLMPENVYTHCSHCLRITWAGIPCDFCIYALYCSEACKEKAWKAYHEVECSIVGPMLELEFNMLGLFSMRLAVQAVREAESLDLLKAEVEQVERNEDQRRRGFSDDGLFHSSAYRSVYGLATNTHLRSVPDLFGRALNSSVIAYFLATRSTLFGEKLEGNLSALVDNADVTFVGGLVMTHQQIIPSNGHTFDEERGMNAVERGVAAMPFCSLFNHSCDPQITRECYPEHIVLYALYPIEKNEQIFDNYGQHFAVMPKPQRQQKLRKQFYFTCDCVPCREDWPLYDDLPTYTSLAQTEYDRTKIASALKKYTAYMAIAATGNVKDHPNMLKDLLNMVEVLFDHVPRPCQDLNVVVETIKRVYALLGNRYDMPSLSHEAY